MVFGNRTIVFFLCGLHSFVTGLSACSFVFNKLYAVGLRSLCKHQPELLLTQEKWEIFACWRLEMQAFRNKTVFLQEGALKKSCSPISCLHIWTLWPRTVKWLAHNLKTSHPQVCIVWFRSLLRGHFISEVSGANLSTVFHTTNYSLYLFSACFKNHHLCIYYRSFPTRMTIIFMEFVCCHVPRTCLIADVP